MSKKLLSGLSSICVAFGHAFGPQGVAEILKANLTNVDSLMSGFSARR